MGQEYEVRTLLGEPHHESKKPGRLDRENRHPKTHPAFFGFLHSIPAGPEFGGLNKVFSFEGYTQRKKMRLKRICVRRRRSTHPDSCGRDQI